MKTVNPYDLTEQDLNLIRQNGWQASALESLPQKFWHPTIKKSGSNLPELFNGAEAIEIILNNMRETIKQGIAY